MPQQLIQPSGNAQGIWEPMCRGSFTYEQSSLSLSGLRSIDAYQLQSRARFVLYLFSAAGRARVRKMHSRAPVLHQNWILNV